MATRRAVVNPLRTARAVRTMLGMDEIEALRAENARLRQWLTLGVRDRIADYLVSLPGGRLEPDGSWRVLRPPTHVELAKAIGSAREVMSRVTGKMRKGYEIIWGTRVVAGRPVTLYLSPALVERVRALRAAR